ncbi:MAG: hypothetical protein IKX59_03755 [Bacteroidales bacterium]|nr:hypothetical protein [Bacteroidales bacterium]
MNYISNTAYTTTSNTMNWEYVGYTHSEQYVTNISTTTDDVQTIKYWDYGASNYVFTAVSAKPEDITNGLVKIAKTTSGSTVYDKGYVVTLAKGSDNTYPSLADLYFSDRNVIEKSQGTDRTAKDTYGGNATMKFRNSLSQVRVGMFETVPGYDITAITFKVTGDNDAKNTSDEDAFGAICPNVTASNFEGTITVTYFDDTNTDTENQPKLTITPGSGLSNTDLILGTNINGISTTAPLATTSAAPTFDTDGGAFTAVLPQIANTSNLKLKVNYTLYNSVTKEIITVENATAEIPATYVAWKPNYKYTYLFKISDNTNGSTGTGDDPAGLYPITFDAVEVVAEDGQAEYITTVSEPSITTFGVKDGKYVYGGSEYTAGCDIYATFVEDGSVIKPTSTNYKVYTVTTTDATTYPITEASVAESVAQGPSSITTSIYTFDGTSYTEVTDPTTLTTGTTYYKADANSVAPGGEGYIQTIAVAGTDFTIGSVITCTAYTTNVVIVDEVPGEDGVNITQDAVKLGSIAAGTYAIEYTASATWTGTYDKVYKVIVVQ